MRKVDYVKEISESELELLELEQRLRGKRTAVRVLMLRLLKSERISTLTETAPIVGYCLRQLQNWWALYRNQGMKGLMEIKSHQGKASKLTEEAFAGLEAEMKAGKIATLKDAQSYLSRDWKIVYRSLNGVWLQLHKRRAKPKTGRRRHRRANAERQEAFKKTSVTSLQNVG
jgi:transposase